MEIFQNIWHNQKKNQGDHSEEILPKYKENGLTKTEIVEGMVLELATIQQADNLSVSVNQKEVEERYDELVELFKKQNIMSDEEIYEALEETVYDLLLSANEHKDVEIRLFTGFGMFSKLVPSHEKKMPDGEIKTIEPTLKFSARYSARWRKDNIKEYREALKLWERVKGRKG